MTYLFFINAVAFGIGLAMDAFSVSLANGLNDPGMSKSRMTLIAGTFAFFQAIMPLIGWFCIHTIFILFNSFHKFIPWIALILLSYIGIKMIYEANKPEEETEKTSLSIRDLLIQGIATSIDALSVGFTIAELPFTDAFVEALIIGIITFFICFIGLILGKKFGIKFEKYASYLGGIILIFIGLEILISSLL